MENLFEEVLQSGTVNPYDLANHLRRRRLLSTEEYFEINHQKSVTVAQTVIHCKVFSHISNCKKRLPNCSK